MIASRYRYRQAEPDPIETARADLSGVCGASGGVVTLLDEFIERGDFNGDGLTDIKLDYHFAACSTGSNGFCGAGAGGCSIETYLQNVNGTYRLDY